MMIKDHEDMETAMYSLQNPLQSLWKGMATAAPWKKIYNEGTVDALPR